MTTHLKPWLKPLTLIWAVTGLLWLAGCAGTPVKPLPPEITVAGVKPVNLSLQEQTLLFSLRVKNPNSFSLPIEGLDFTARFSDQDVASGQSTKTADIPGGGEGLIDVEVTTRLSDVVGKIGALLKGGGLKLNYELDGNVKVRNRSEAFPFSLKGDLMSALRQGG